MPQTLSKFLANDTKKTVRKTGMAASESTARQSSARWALTSLRCRPRHHARAGRPTLMAMPTVPPATPSARPAEENKYPIMALAKTCSAAKTPRLKRWRGSLCILCIKLDLVEERSRCRNVNTGTRARLTATRSTFATLDHQSSPKDTRMLGLTVPPYWAYAAKPTAEYSAAHVIKAKSADRMMLWRDSGDISCEMVRTLISTPKQALERATDHGKASVSLSALAEVSMDPVATERLMMRATRPRQARKPRETNLWSRTSLFEAAGAAQTPTMSRPTCSWLSSGINVGTTSLTMVQQELDTRKIVAFRVTNVNTSPTRPRCLLMTPW
mmetsp:Transcript_69254/g.206194  ORF Transcript_69254/g.206194 Transcript_69254/m.206194 type:complete len:327 (-) Transcript_69254:553-1533(-)